MALAILRQCSVLQGRSFKILASPVHFLEAQLSFISTPPRPLYSRRSDGHQWDNIRASMPRQSSGNKDFEEEWRQGSIKDASQLLAPSHTYLGKLFSQATTLADELHALSSILGRSVQVRDGNVGAAYRKLGGILTQNHVWEELRRTERHEKKGAKRRRLRSERWRTRFKEEVSLRPMFTFPLHSNSNLESR